MRRAAFLIAVLFLLTHVGIADARQEARPRPQALTPEEETRLAARAARTPELEHFAAGAGEEAVIYGLVFAAIIAFSAGVGLLLACPLGLTHSTQGRGFVPADCLKTPSKTVNWFNGCAVTVGFPLYVMGYLMGLPCEAPRSPPTPAEDKREREKE